MASAAEVLFILRRIRNQEILVNLLLHRVQALENQVALLRDMDERISRLEAAFINMSQSNRDSLVESSVDSSDDSDADTVIDLSSVVESSDENDSKSDKGNDADIDSSNDSDDPEDDRKGDAAKLHINNEDTTDEDEASDHTSAVITAFCPRCLETHYMISDN